MTANASGNVESEVNGSEEKDSHVIPSTSKMTSASTVQVLEQLQRVNRLLDKVEGRMAKEGQGNKGKDSGTSAKKLSSFCK